MYLTKSFSHSILESNSFSTANFLLTMRIISQKPPFVILIISIIIMYISLREPTLQITFFKVLPLFIIGTYITMSATYYFSILRGIRDFKFLAQRNIISSVIKILVATILSFTSLGIVGVWIGYLVYGIVQKYLSKKRYKELANNI